ncbi:MAG TPA: cohesin domain-containing protein [Candidatus Saccharimonadales bacterium]|nr:cohesin domain-containing protein [Candidatus Saccharimonadales bacterium]
MKIQSFLRSRGFRQATSFLTAAFFIGSVSFLGVRYYNSSIALSGATMQVSPSTGSYAAGSTVSFTIREDSGSTPVNSVQASLKYDAARLQFVSVTEGGAFSLKAATSTGEPGIVRVARAIQSGTLTGDLPIVTINFKVLASGTTEVTLDRDFSSVVRASDSQNILEALTNGSYTLTAASTATPPPATSAPTGAKAVLSLQPGGGNYALGATIPVAVRVNTAARLTVVQAVIKYPANLLQYVRVENTGSFPTAGRDVVSGDTVNLTRGIAGGGTPVSGDAHVATVHFKVLAGSGTAPVTFTGASGVYDNSGSGQNILDLLSSKGTYYALGSTPAGTNNPPQAAAPPSSSPNASQPNTTSGSTVTRAIRRAGGLVSVSPTSTGNASISTNDQTQLAGAVDFSPVANPDILAANPGDEIVKVEYSLDKEVVATMTEAPFTYRFDTQKLKNGSYTMTVKTFYKSGTVDVSTDTLLVKNPVTLSYVMANYSMGILGSLVALATIAFVAWRFLLPRFLGGPAAVTALAGPGQPTGEGSGSGMALSAAPAAPKSDWEGFAPEPAVVRPTNAPATPLADDSLRASEQAASTLTHPIAIQNPQVVTTAAPQNAPVNLPSAAAAPTPAPSPVAYPVNPAPAAAAPAPQLPAAPPQYPAPAVMPTPASADPTAQPASSQAPAQPYDPQPPRV